MRRRVCCAWRSLPWSGLSGPTLRLGAPRTSDFQIAGTPASGLPGAAAGTTRGLTDPTISRQLKCFNCAATQRRNHDFADSSAASTLRIFAIECDCLGPMPRPRSVECRLRPTPGNEGGQCHSGVQPNAPCRLFRRCRGPVCYGTRNSHGRGFQAGRLWVGERVAQDAGYGGLGGQFARQSQHAVRDCR